MSIDQNCPICKGDGEYFIAGDYESGLIKCECNTDIDMFPRLGRGNRSNRNLFDE